MLLGGEQGVCADRALMLWQSFASVDRQSHVLTTHGLVQQPPQRIANVHAGKARSSNLCVHELLVIRYFSSLHTSSTTPSWPTRARTATARRQCACWQSGINERVHDGDVKVLEHQQPYASTLVLAS